MADKYPGISPYAYCNNNPMRYVDPTGMSFGNFYDENGGYLGADGKADGKVYVVTDKKDIGSIKSTNKSGGTTSANDVNSKVELPSFGLRGKMSNIVGMDNDDSFREYGGLIGLDINGNENVFWANPGERANPLVDNKASIDMFNIGGVEGNAPIGDAIFGTFHSHPSGVASNDNILNSSHSRKSSDLGTFNQHVSPADYNAARNKSSILSGNSYVFGMGSGKVHIYDGSGTKAKFPISAFGAVK